MDGKEILFFFKKRMTDCFVFIGKLRVLILILDEIL